MKITGVEISLRYDDDEDFEHEGYYDSVADAISSLYLTYLNNDFSLPKED